MGTSNKGPHLGFAWIVKGKHRVSRITAKCLGIWLAWSAARQGGATRIRNLIGRVIGAAERHIRGIAHAAPMPLSRLTSATVVVEGLATMSEMNLRLRADSFLQYCPA